MKCSFLGSAFVDVIIEMFLIYAVTLPAHCLPFCSSPNFILFVTLPAFAWIRAQLYLIRNIIFCYINYKFEWDIATEFPQAFFLEEDRKSQGVGKKLENQMQL